MGRFSEFVKSASPCNPSLPLTHTCDGLHFRGIADKSELETSPCNIFKGEDLLYFFYGRPSYRTAKDGQAMSLSAFFPVCIMLKPDTVPNPKRIAPFDTGAFKSGRFSEHFHPEMKWEDFLLEPISHMANRLVSRFYGSNEKYFAGNPITINVPPIEFEVQSYYNLIKSQHVGQYDDRISSVEIQSAKNIVLDSGKVLLVVLPLPFLDVLEIRYKILKEWNAQVGTYETHRCNPNEYMMLIYSEIKAFLETNNYL